MMRCVTAHIDAATPVGLSQIAKVAGDGTNVRRADVAMPYQLVLRPRVATPTDCRNFTVHDAVKAIAPGETRPSWGRVFVPAQEVRRCISTALRDADSRVSTLWLCT